MSSMKLFLVLILATALHQIVAARIGALVSTTASLSGSKAATTAYYPPAPSSPSIMYEIMDNSTTPGDSRFKNEIGLIRGVETLATASQYVLDTLYNGQEPNYGKDYTYVLAIIESFSQAGISVYPREVASTVGNDIRINSDYIEYFNGDIRYEFTGILYHESTRVWQWNGNGMAPTGLVTGIADFVRLKAGWPSVTWGERGSGYQWDQGYEVTAYFLEYLNGIREGFVPMLNAMMKDSYSDDFFVSIFGESVDDLWVKYKTDSDLPSPAPAPPMFALSITCKLRDNSTFSGNSRVKMEIGHGQALVILTLTSSYVLDTLYQGQELHDSKDYAEVEVVESSNAAGLRGYPKWPVRWETNSASTQLALSECAQILGHLMYRLGCISCIG